MALGAVVIIAGVVGAVVIIAVAVVAVVIIAVAVAVAVGAVVADLGLMILNLIGFINLRKRKIGTWNFVNVLQYHCV